MPRGWLNWLRVHVARGLHNDDTASFSGQNKWRFIEKCIEGHTHTHTHTLNICTCFRYHFFCVTVDYYLQRMLLMLGYLINSTRTEIKTLATIYIQFDFFPSYFDFPQLRHIHIQEHQLIRCKTCVYQTAKP